MTTHIIEIKNDKLTEKQKFRLAVLEFRASDSTHVVWTYKAMDLQDLVSTIEDIQEAESLKDIVYKIKRI